MELKKVVARSHERKVSLGDYNMATYWASYSEEVSADTGPEELKRISALLYEMAKSDVEQAIEDYKKVEALKRIDNGGWEKPKYELSPKN